MKYILLQCTFLSCVVYYWLFSFQLVSRQTHENEGVREGVRDRASEKRDGDATLVETMEK